MSDVERFACVYCGKRLRRDPYARERGYGYDGNGFFCTLRCGFAWALRNVSAR